MKRYSSALLTFFLDPLTLFLFKLQLFKIYVAKTHFHFVSSFARPFVEVRCECLLRSFVAVPNDVPFASNFLHKLAGVRLCLGVRCMKCLRWGKQQLGREVSTRGPLEVSLHEIPLPEATINKHYDCAFALPLRSSWWAVRRLPNAFTAGSSNCSDIRLAKLLGETWKLTDFSFY